MGGVILLNMWGGVIHVNMWGVVILVNAWRFYTCKYVGCYVNMWGGCYPCKSVEML